jgi:hypothetical protein
MGASFKIMRERSARESPGGRHAAHKSPFFFHFLINYGAVNSVRRCAQIAAKMVLVVTIS